jgi:hypothetical protein
VATGTAPALQADQRWPRRQAIRRRVSLQHTRDPQCRPALSRAACAPEGDSDTQAQRSEEMRAGRVVRRLREMKWGGKYGEPRSCKSLARCRVASSIRWGMQWRQSAAPRLRQERHRECLEVGVRSHHVDTTACSLRPSPPRRDLTLGRGVTLHSSKTSLGATEEEEAWDVLGDLAMFNRSLLSFPLDSDPNLSHGEQEVTRRPPAREPVPWRL